MEHSSKKDDDNNEQQPSIQHVSIDIVQGKDGAEFHPSALEILIGTTGIWTNQTNEIQEILPFKGGPLAPQAGAMTSFRRVGTEIFHLQSNPNALLTIKVTGEVIQLIAAHQSTSRTSFKFAPDILTFKSGTWMLWRNRTDEMQVFISDSNSKDISLQRREDSWMHAEKVGTFTWHLQSDPNVTVTLVVEG